MVNALMTITKAMKPIRKNDGQNGKTAAGHAVVIGSGIAGLTAARVLADHYARVTIIERDRLPEGPEFRASVPQARHAHTLLAEGQRILEGHFPGLTDDLLAAGGISIDPLTEMVVYIGGEGHSPRNDASSPRIGVSRPLLEHAVYRRVAAHPRVEILQGREVASLITDTWGRRVVGVRVRERGNTNASEVEMAADLVVDASGRRSQATEWLTSLGYPAPRVMVVDAFAGYASRIYRRPDGYQGDWKVLYVRPTPPDGTRGGVILPLEDGRWHVTLIGMGRDYPPTDEAGFLEYARSLPAPAFYEAIQDAEPLGRPAGYWITQSQRRHYEELARHPEGFLAYGDAVYAMNPVYAQGMTAAALGSLALQQALAAQPGQDLPRVYYQELSRMMARTWRLATREDQRWPMTEVIVETPMVRPAMPSLVTRPMPVVRPVELAAAA
jgi:2-polyprenyl-6-methoxyphenol hydroxylase-like FAD-dependent oxidoreductase